MFSLSGKTASLWCANVFVCFPLWQYNPDSHVVLNHNTSNPIEKTSFTDWKNQWPSLCQHNHRRSEWTLFSVFRFSITMKHCNTIIHPEGFNGRGCDLWAPKRWFVHGPALAWTVMAFVSTTPEHDVCQAKAVQCYLPAAPEVMPRMRVHYRWSHLDGMQRLLHILWSPA